MPVAIARPVRTMPTAISSCLLKLASSRASRASDLLEAELHGVEQALEGAVVLTLRDEGVDGLIDLSWRSRWLIGRERRPDAACRASGGC